jgi:hypothetical protein
MRVSLPVAAEGGRLRVALAALCAAALMAVAAVAAPSPAHAAFTVAHCQGAPVEGQGSSAQNEAQNEFWSTTVWHGTEEADGCTGSAPTVTYTGSGSGCGIASIGGEASSVDCQGFTEAESKAAAEAKVAFRATTQFAGSDAPLTATQQLNADASGGTKPGLIHQIPVTAFAVAIIVHFPDGCQLKSPGTGPAANGVGSENEDTSTGGPNDPPGGQTGDAAAKETLRVHITDEELEKIWDGTPQTWGNIVPQEQFGNALEVERIACAAVPVTRIVRFDGSGTTFNFKSFLSLLPGAPTGLWTEAPVAGDKQIWPETFNAEKKVPSPVNSSTKICESANHICTAAASKGGPLTEAVAANSGSIGYADLATSRKHGFYMEKEKNDHTYWIPVQTVSPEEGNKVGTTYVEPTEKAESNTSSSPEGADCTDADYRGYPTEGADPTLGDWEKSIATGATATAIKNDPTHSYPVCGLTYDFAWDDYATTYENTQAEQEKARTVKDYLQSIESTKGQFQVSGHDYGTLPLNIIKIAQIGVAAIDWNKAAGSGGPKEEIKTPPKEEKPAGSGGPPIVTPPSNAFSIAGAKVKGKAIVLSLVLPGPGKVQIKATGGGVTVASVIAVVKAGDGSVTLSISKAALSKLAKIKGHKFGVKITVTFTPTGGAAAGKTKTIMLTKAATVTKKASKGKGKK